MLDRDLAELYDVTIGNLNKGVKRNGVAHSATGLIPLLHGRAFYRSITTEHTTISLLRF